MDDLILLSLLSGLRKGVPCIPNGTGEGQEYIVLAYPGKQQIGAAEHQERNFERWAGSSELHELAEPVRGSKDHIYDDRERQ